MKSIEMSMRINNSLFIIGFEYYVLVDGLMAIEVLLWRGGELLFEGNMMSPKCLSGLSGPEGALNSHRKCAVSLCLHDDGM